MRAARITADEQYRLIMECRASGLTDHEWCLQHDIKPGTYYNGVKRLRKKGCQNIPDARRVHCAPQQQEVVKIELTSPDRATKKVIPSFQQPESCQMQESSMELSVSGTIRRIPNGTDSVLLRQTLLILRELSC